MLAGFAVSVTRQPAQATAHPLTTMVSVDAGGAPVPGAASEDASVSADGRRVAFTSRAALVPTDIDGAVPDIYLHDRGPTDDSSDDTILLISQHRCDTDPTPGPDPCPSDGDSYEPFISADGRAVAFVSDSERLDAIHGDTGDPFVDANSLEDVFIAWLEDGPGGVPVLNAITLESLDPPDDVTPGAQIDDGQFSDPVLSSDASYLAFATDAGLTRCALPNAAAAPDGAGGCDDTNGDWDIYVRAPSPPASSAPSAVQLVSQHPCAGCSEGDAVDPSISDDGQTIAFVSDAEDHLPDGAGEDSNDAPDVFVRTWATGDPATDTIIASVDDAGDQTVTFSTPAVPGGCASAALHVRCRSVSLSGDARAVAYTSGATDLVPGDTNDRNDIFVHQLVDDPGGLDAGTTVRASVAADGSQANDENREPSISGNGRRVAFSSAATNLIEGDTNAAGGFCYGDDLYGPCDTFVRDLAGIGTTFRANLSEAGAQAADGTNSSRPWLSANGLVIAFDSNAENLAAADVTAGISELDVFVRDVEKRLVVAVPVSSALTFGAVGVNQTSERPIVVRNAGSEPALVSALTMAGTDAAAFTVSSDNCTGAFLHPEETCGLFVQFAPTQIRAFEAELQVDGPADPVVSLFGEGIAAVIIPAGITEVVSLDAPPPGPVILTTPGAPVGGLEPDPGETPPPGKPDGGGEPDPGKPGPGDPEPPDPGTPPPDPDPDPDPGGVSLFGVTTGVQPSVPSTNAAVSADGRYVAFESDGHVWLRDRIAGTTRQVSARSCQLVPGPCTGGAAGDPSISNDGTKVAFASSADDIAAIHGPEHPDAGDPNDDVDTVEPRVFRADMSTDPPTILVASLDSNGDEPDCDSADQPAISGNGRFVAFTTACQMYTGTESSGDYFDFNSSRDVYVRDVEAGEENLTLASQRCDGVGCPPEGDAENGALSFDGTRAAFDSLADDILGTTDANGQQDVFLATLDLTTFAYVSAVNVSVGDGGTQGDGPSSAPSVSDAGTVVAFESSATNLVIGDGNGRTDVFVRDLTGATPPEHFTDRVSVDYSGVEGNQHSAQAAVSRDGRYVAFASAASNLVPLDTNGTVCGPILVAACPLAWDIFSYDRTLARPFRVNVDSAGNQATVGSVSANPSISDDGRYVAFDSNATNLLAPAADANGGVRDVFIHYAVLSTDPTALAFPDTEVSNTSSPLTLRVLNISTGPVLPASLFPIGGANAGDFAVAGTTCTVKLYPGDECAASVVFAPTVEANRTADITIVDSPREDHVDPTNPPVVPLSGKGIVLRMAATLLPADLDFGKRNVDSPLGPCPGPSNLANCQTAVLTNVGDLPFSVGTPSVAPVAEFPITSHTCPATLPVGASCAINMRFTPTDVGTRTGTLTVPHGAGVPNTVRLTGIGTRGRLVLSPDPVAFLPQRVGTTSGSRIVTALNAGDGPVTISGIGLAGTNPTDFVAGSDTCTGTILAPGTQCTVRVRFAPTAAGPREGRLVVGNDSPGNPHSVTLTGLGMAPILLLTPPVVGLGSALVGDPGGTGVITALNVGNEPLTIGSRALSGAPDFAFVSDACGGVTLAPAASCSMTFSFSPTAPGNRLGTLTVSSDDPTGPKQSTLFGVGLTAGDFPVPGSGVVVISGGGGTGERGPILHLTPDPTRFTPTVVGLTSVDHVLSGLSVGSLPVKVDQVVLGGEHVDEFEIVSDTCTGAVIAPLEGCAIGLRFSPAERGERVGEITVRSNAIGSPQTVPLEGLGLIPQLRAVPSLGPPGFVTQLVGEEFPPEIDLILGWNPGLGTARARTDAEGRFTAPLLVFRRDRLGLRSAEARADGFTVSTGFLVVSPSIIPPDFVTRS